MTKTVWGGEVDDETIRKIKSYAFVDQLVSKSGARTREEIEVLKAIAITGYATLDTSQARKIAFLINKYDRKNPGFLKEWMPRECDWIHEQRSLQFELI